MSQMTIIRNVRIYFVDPGLRNARLNFRQLEKVIQEHNSLRNVDNSFKKVIIVGYPILVERDNDGITTMSVYDFLLRENSLEL